MTKGYFTKNQQNNYRKSKKILVLKVLGDGFEAFCVVLKCQVRRQFIGLVLFIIEHT